MLKRYWAGVRFACYEGEGGDGVGGAGGAVGGAASGGAAGSVNDGGGGSGGGAAKMFTQDDLNKHLAEDRRKHQTKLQEMETKLKAALDSNTLTEKDRKALQENLETVQGQLRSKEEQLTVEKKQLQEQYAVQLKEANEKASFFENLYRDSTVERALTDAATKHEAFQPFQLANQLRPLTKLVPEVDPKTGKPTGKYKPMVEMQAVNQTTGEMETKAYTPEDAVKKMKDDPDTWGNMFRSGVRSGIGSSSATGGLTSGNGQIDLRKITPQQYLKIQKENPELLRTRPTGRR
jgi:hypothetical protein